MSMTENPKVLVVGGGRGFGKELIARMELLEELENYRAIGTVEEFRELKEKATPKKPILNPICKCPICDHVLPYALVKYCSNCGTALDCSEGKERTENSKWKESMMRTFLGSRK